MKSGVMQCRGWSVDHPGHYQDEQSRCARWNPRPDPAPARLPSKSRLRCCAVVRHHRQELSGTDRVMLASSRLNCLPVPHWLLEKWGVLRVKWRVTDEATESNPCALGERGPCILEQTLTLVNTRVPCFFVFVLWFITNTCAQDASKLSCHGNPFEANKELLWRHMKLDLEPIIMLLYSFMESIKQECDR